MPKIDKKSTVKYEGKDGAWAIAEIRSDSGGDCRYVSVRAGTADKDKREMILVHVCIDCGTVHVSDGRVDGKKPKKEWRISRDPDIELKPGTVRI